MAHTSVLLFGLAACSNDDPTSPGASLAGSWELIGFTEGDVSATTTGTARFDRDGTFEFAGTITFPGELAEPLDVQGTYQLNGERIVLTTSEGSAAWILRFEGDEVLLTSEGPPPRNTITLRRA